MYYQDFLRRQSSDPGVRVEASAAYEHVGDIQKELGQFDDALAAYDKGLALADQPGQSAAKLRMEGSRIDCLVSLGRFAEGIATFDRAIAPFREGRPAPADLQAVLLKLYNAGGELYSRSGKKEEAEKTSQKALEIGEVYTRDHPKDREAILDLMFAYTFTTRSLRHSGRGAGASQVGQRGLDWGEAYIRTHPKDIDIQVSLSDMYSELAICEFTKQQPERAMKYSRLSVSLLEAVCRANPLLFKHRLSLSESLSTLSNLEYNQGLFPEARRSADHSIELARDILARSPELPRAKENLGVCLFSLGRAQLKSSDSARAYALFQQSCELLEQSSEPGYLYNAACAAAQTSSINDSTESGSAARRARDAERAVVLFKSAVEHGMSDLDLITADPDLDAIRPRPDFQAVVKMLEAKVGKPTPAPKK